MSAHAGTANARVLAAIGFFFLPTNGAIVKCLSESGTSVMSGQAATRCDRREGGRGADGPAVRRAVDAAEGRIMIGSSTELNNVIPLGNSLAMREAVLEG